MVLIQYFFHSIFQIKLVFVILILALTLFLLLPTTKIWRLDFISSFQLPAERPSETFLLPGLLVGKCFFSLSDGEYIENLLSFPWGMAEVMSLGRGWALALCPMLLLSSKWWDLLGLLIRAFGERDALGYDRCQELMRPLRMEAQMKLGREQLHLQWVSTERTEADDRLPWHCSLCLSRHSYLLSHLWHPWCPEISMLV